MLLRARRARREQRLLKPFTAPTFVDVEPQLLAMFAELRRASFSTRELLRDALCVERA